MNKKNNAIIQIFAEVFLIDNIDVSIHEKYFAFKDFLLNDYLSDLTTVQKNLLNEDYKEFDKSVFARVQEILTEEPDFGEMKYTLEIMLHLVIFNYLYIRNEGVEFSKSYLNKIYLVIEMPLFFELLHRMFGIELDDTYLFNADLALNEEEREILDVTALFLKKSVEAF